MTFNALEEIRKITEAYCAENNIPFTRKYSDEELEETFQRLAEAKVLVKSLQEGK